MRVFEKRVALKSDGTPHPFVWYGPGSQWIEHRLGVFRCPEAEYGDQCMKKGCDWILEPQKYDPKLLAELEADSMPHFVPKVLLKCTACGAVAHPWKLWNSKVADG